MSNINQTDLIGQKSIGVFDSGIGGLTVANAINRLLPNEHLIYFGDTAHLPYGDKSADAIRYYALRISKFLLEQDCKMIIIACNSASAAASDMLMEFFDGKVLFANVIDPLVQHTISKGYKNIGVIATKATIRSNVYQSKLKSYNQTVKVNQLATPLLAPMIEEGFFHNNISQEIIKNYLSDKRMQDLDTLLLACTHYPLIRSEIEAYYHGNVDVLDSCDVLALQVKDMLTQENLLSQKRNKEHKYYVSDFTQSFEDTAKLFNGSEIELEVKNIW